MRFGLCGDYGQLELAKRAGFQYLEMKVTEIAGWDDVTFRHHLAEIRESGMECRCFNVLFPGDMSLLGEEADETRRNQYLHHAFARLQQMGGEIVVFGSGRARRKPEGMEFFRGYQELVKVTRAIGEIASQYQLIIVIEPLNRMECNMINSMAEGALLVADVDLANVRLLTDFYHVAMDHEPLSDITRIGDFAHVHIASRKDRRYPFPGQADDYAQFFQRLKEIGYTGRISIEGGAEDIVHEGRVSLSYLKKLWENA